MLKILRKHRNWLMIVIAILALPFCLYFVKSDTSQIRSDEFARLYGRKVSILEARRDVRLFQLAQLLGMSDFQQDLAPGNGKNEQEFPDFVINLTVLRHEAEQLGLEPSDAQIVEAVRNFPAFHGQSGFDTAKYDQFTQTVLPSLGFSDEQLKEIARDEFCLKRIQQILAASVSLPESETRANYEEFYGKNFASVVRVHSADLMKEVQVNDDDIKKYFEAHKTELKTEEKRKVELVRLAFTEEQKKLKDKERIDALQKLADRANDVSQALLEKGADFHQVAAKFQLPVETTAEFTASAPDPKLNKDQHLTEAAFKLTTQDPNSDPVQTADGFAIVHLGGIVESRPLTLDEAKQRVVDQIKSERAREMALAKGRKAAETLRNGLKAGQPLKFTLEQAGGLKAEKLEPFTLAEDAEAKPQPDKPKEQSADIMLVKNAAAQLQPGEVSDFAPWIDGGIIVLLEKREPPDPAKYQETKAKFEEDMLKRNRTIVFYEWLRSRQRDAGVEFGKG
jgi:peptidyl-prolyl cis-trans isomerase D